MSDNEDWLEEHAFERGRRDMLFEVWAQIEDLLPDGLDDFEGFTPHTVRQALVMKSSIEFHYGDVQFETREQDGQRMYVAWRKEESE